MGKSYSDEFLCAVLLIGLAFGLIGGMAIYAVAYPVFQSKYWWDIATAVGTVGAVIVALWQSRASHAREDARVRKEAEVTLVRARLAAQRLRLPLSIASSDLNKLARLFERAHDDYTLAPKQSEVEWLLESIRRDLGDPDLVTLYPLSPESASSLAEVIGTVEWHIRMQRQNLHRLPQMTVADKYAHLHLSEGTLAAANIRLQDIWTKYQHAALFGQF